MNRSSPRTVHGGEEPTNNLRDKVRALQLSNKTAAAPATANRGLWVFVLLVILGGWFAWNQGWFTSASSTSKNTASRNADTNITETAATSVSNRSEAPADNVATSNSAKVEPSNSGAKNLPVANREAAPAVKKETVSREGIVLESNGYFMPARKILVSPKVSGMLMSFNLQEGQRVQKGQVIGVIESTEYEADLRRSQASLELARQRLLELENGFRTEEVEQAKAELDETLANLKRSEADYTRGRDLLQKNSFTQSEFDQVVASYNGLKRRAEKLKAALKLMQIGPREERKEQARAEVAQAEAEVMKAQWRLDNCKIRSPISGTILTKNAEEGNIVNPVAMNGSFSVCDLADLADLEVDLKIQERDVARIFAGQKCKVRAIAYPDRIYDGVVDRLMPIADRSKGAVPIRVKVVVPSAEEGVYLKPDMGAIVSFYAK